MPYDPPPYPARLQRLDARAGESGVPGDWWRYETLLDGVIIERVVCARAGSPGYVLAGDKMGKLAELPPGEVVIRVRERWAAGAGPAQDAAESVQAAEKPLLSLFGYKPPRARPAPPVTPDNLTLDLELD